MQIGVGSKKLGIGWSFLKKVKWGYNSSVLEATFLYSAQSLTEENSECQSEL
jgi:hypothetical protein